MNPSSDDRPGGRRGLGLDPLARPGDARPGLGDDAALDDAQAILAFVEALSAVEDLQTLLDLLAEGVARTAGWDVAVLSVYLPDGAILGGYHLPEDERVRFLSSMARTPLAMRLAKRAKIRDLAFPGTGIAYVPHTVDLSRSIAFAKSRPNEHGTWHPEDRLFVLVKTGTGQEIGVLSLDEPLDGMAPSLATLGPLRVVERLLVARGGGAAGARPRARPQAEGEGLPRARGRRARGHLPARRERPHVVGEPAARGDLRLPVHRRGAGRRPRRSSTCTPRPTARRSSRASRRGSEVRAVDMRARRRDGTPIRLRMVMRREPDGELQGIVEDVTDGRRLEEHLQRAQRLEAIGTLASGVAHDFNNLLAGILGYASLLEQRLATDPSLGPMARGIQEAALRAADLTRGLLGVVRSGSGRAVACRRRGGPRRGGAHRARDVRPTHRDVRPRADADLPAAVVAASELHRALLNLAINARDAMPEGGEIALVAEPDEVGPRTLPPDASRGGPWVRVEVRDTGIGMPQSIRARLFEPFFTTKPRGKGTGLGLYGVYQFLRAFGGAVEVDSRVGAGDDVPRLPARGGAGAADPVARPPGGGVGVRARGRGRSGADPGRRGRGCGAAGRGARPARDAGHEVTEASDGEEAVRRFAARPDAFELVVLDLVLPRLSGKEVLRRVRAVRPDIPVLLTSGNVHEGLEDPEVRAGIRGVLPKPYLPGGPARGRAGGADGEGSGGTWAPRPDVIPYAFLPRHERADVPWRHHGEVVEQGPREGSDPGEGGRAREGAGAREGAPAKVAATPKVAAPVAAKAPRAAGEGRQGAARAPHRRAGGRRHRRGGRP